MTEKEIEKYFYPTTLNKYNYDYYIPRTGVLDFLLGIKPHLKGKVVDLACGHMPYKKLFKSSDQVIDYLPMDVASEEIYKNNDLVQIWDGEQIPLESNSVDTVVVTELLEHVSYPVNILKEIKRILKPDGKIIGTVPFIWPVHEAPHDHARYTSYGIKKIIEESGLEVIQIDSLGGRKKQLALSIAFWLKDKRSFLSKFTRSFWVFFMRNLVRKDKKEDIWKEGAIFTGLGFVAIKRDDKAL